MGGDWWEPKIKPKSKIRTEAQVTFGSTEESSAPLEWGYPRWGKSIENDFGHINAQRAYQCVGFGMGV